MFTGQLIAPDGLSGVGINYAWRIAAARLFTVTCSMEMRLMTLQTQERLVLHKQVVGYCAVSIMTEGTVFNHRLVQSVQPILPSLTG